MSAVEPTVGPVPVAHDTRLWCALATRSTCGGTGRTRCRCGATRVLRHMRAESHRRVSHTFGRHLPTGRRDLRRCRSDGADDHARPTILIRLLAPRRCRAAETLESTAVTCTRRTGPCRTPGHTDAVTRPRGGDGDAPPLARSARRRSGSRRSPDATGRSRLTTMSGGAARRTPGARYLARLNVCWDAATEGDGDDGAHAATSVHRSRTTPLRLAVAAATRRPPSFQTSRARRCPRARHGVYTGTSPGR